jgi:hypothetical protein
MNMPTAMPPFTKDEMEAELREILFIQASQISHAGITQAAIDFIGFEFDFSPVNTPVEADFAKIDLTRFSARAYLTTTYDYAFQVGESWMFSEDDNHNIIAFAGGVTPEASYGDPSPFLAPGSRCRHVIDMAVGRWNLESDDSRDLTIRQLALLASMTEAAVRNSLSTEKIRTRGKPVAVSPQVAGQWLKARKGFVPTQHKKNRQAFRVAHTRSLLAAPRLPSGVQILLSDLSMSPETLAEKAKVPIGFVTSLLEGKIDISDLNALQRIGAALDVDVPYFVGQSIEASLRSEN